MTVNKISNVEEVFILMNLPLNQNQVRQWISDAVKPIVTEALNTFKNSRRRLRDLGESVIKFDGSWRVSVNPEGSV